jgi:hypothetical protein
MSSNYRKLSEQGVLDRLARREGVLARSLFPRFVSTIVQEGSWEKIKREKKEGP